MIAKKTNITPKEHSSIVVYFRGYTKCIVVLNTKFLKGVPDWNKNVGSYANSNKIAEGDGFFEQNLL